MYLVVGAYLLFLFAWRINWLIKQHSAGPAAERAPKASETGFPYLGRGAKPIF
jgi:hypothetical protein